MSLILDLLASGVPVEEILADYRGLTKEDIHACIAFSGKRRRDWRRWAVWTKGRHGATEENRRQADMRVFVDTSVWIDHFRRADAELKACLRSGRVWTHTVVIGELAAGQLKQREEILRHLQKLPRADEIGLAEGLHFIDGHRLAGRGLSWSDVQLLAAARIDGARIWTHDKPLSQTAAELGLAFAG